MAEDRIRIAGIRATGYHGVLDHERRDGQVFVADVLLHLDTREAAEHDDLTRTVDYGAVAAQVHDVLTGPPADLVETVAERIAAAVLEHDAVQAVDVVLHKPQAPIGVPFADVTVEVHRSREHPPAVASRRTQAAEQASPGGRGATRLPGDPVGAPVAPPQVSSPVAPPQVSSPAGRAGESAATPPPVLPFPDLDNPLEDLPADAPSGPAYAVPTWSPVIAQPDPGPGAPVPGLEPLTGPHDAVAPGAAGPRSDEPDGPTDVMDAVPPEAVDVVLALGSNLGPSREILRAAIGELDAVDGLEVTAVAPLARTAAVGGPDQADFLNTVVLGRTTLSPRALLRACQAVEAHAGRERIERWGPRTLDIDLVVHGSTVAVADDLELPHPRAHQRAFVLEPWAQVDPDAWLPGLGGGPVAVLAGTAPDRGGIRWLALDWWTTG
ncbi:2-amino-4-hydroxy-6-hydroxymethyldihydropteridine diphosphokinase [Isoptericola sp. b441]|uniref:Bifunctional folate synthesis protein n=1 Tax=Actinotalea lenta TaxID=3064654 RepID=A0ABT9DBL1_9CELL|nr:2-amino-4-hydroxy-6-hydroxymethyldihydropteridine diphosphokinase [Isoptericola sp. b441]MDO8106588.1 2-amino-4-hydroxy-6-hydroxymethyldihydropteridine diphosphokinase [Isoptericola sp. b441]